MTEYELIHRQFDYVKRELNNFIRHTKASPNPEGAVE